MRKAFFTALLALACVSLKAQSGITDIRVNEVFRKIPLSKALKTIQENYNIRIAYDPALIQNVLVAIRLSDATVVDAFERLLAGTPLTYNNVGENIIIVPRATESRTENVSNITRTLSGRIVDAESEETLPLATIRIVGSQVGVTSNNDGHFTMLQVPADTGFLEISYIGYLTQIIPIKEINEFEKLKISLNSDTKILNEVVVLDEFNQAMNLEKQAGALVFNPRALNSLPSLGEQDIFRSMQLMPGVTATDESSSGMVIRGTHPSYNLVLLDGMTLYQQDHFFGSFSIINTDIIKDVRVHKGMFDAKYGGRAAGVIDITSKNGAVKPAFNVRLNGINAKATSEIPLGDKLSLFVAGRRSFTDVVQSNLFKDLFGIAYASNDQVQLFRYRETLGDPNYFFHDANTKLTFRPTTRDVIALSLYASRDKMEIEDKMSFGSDTEKFEIVKEEVTRWGNNGVSMRWGRQWNEKYYSNVRISNSKFFRKYVFDQSVELDMSNIAYFLSFDNSISDLSYAIDNEWLYSDKLSLEFGMLGVRQNADVHFKDKYVSTGDVPSEELPEDIDLTILEGSWLHSLYGAVVFTPVNRMQVSAGSRLSHYSNKGSATYLEPRLNVAYSVSNQVNLKAAYGRSNQFITQLFYYSPTGSVSGINENFWMLSSPGKNGYPVISSDQVSGGVTLTNNNFAYDAELYFKESNGVIIDEDLNAGTTSMYGVDLMVQKTSGIHKGWIAYSLARGVQMHPYVFNGRHLPSLYDQRHEAKLVNMVTLSDWTLASTVICGSGRPYSRYTIKYFRDENGNINDFELVPDYSNESRLPAYFRIDISASYKRQLKNVAIETGLSIHNVTNHKNVKTRQIDTMGLEEAIFTNTELPARYNDILLLGFSPSMFLNISF